MPPCPPNPVRVRVGAAPVAISPGALVGRQIVFLDAPLGAPDEVLPGSRWRVRAIEEAEDDVWRLDIAAKDAIEGSAGLSLLIGRRRHWPALFRLVADDPRRARLEDLFDGRDDPGQGWTEWLEARLLALDPETDPETDPEIGSGPEAGPMDHARDQADLKPALRSGDRKPAPPPGSRPMKPGPPAFRLRAVDAARRDPS